MQCDVPSKFKGIVGSIMSAVVFAVAVVTAVAAVVMSGGFFTSLVIVPLLCNSCNVVVVGKSSFFSTSVVVVVVVVVDFATASSGLETGPATPSMVSELVVVGVGGSLRSHVVVNSVLPPSWSCVLSIMARVNRSNERKNQTGIAKGFMVARRIALSKCSVWAAIKC